MADKKSQDSKKGKPRSAGKAKGKIAGYYASGRLLQKKIRRILRSNGVQAARNYAEKMGQMMFFKSLVKPEVVQRIESASERRRQARQARRNTRASEREARLATEKLRAEEAAKLRAETEAIDRAVAELKAKRSAAAKKGVATKAAKKAAKLAATVADNQVASS